MKLKTLTDREKLVYGIGGGLAIAGTVLLGGLFLYCNTASILASIAAGIKQHGSLVCVVALFSSIAGGLGWFAFCLLRDVCRFLGRVCSAIDRLLDLGK